jgi:hypothetical protein
MNKRDDELYRTEEDYLNQMKIDEAADEALGYQLVAQPEGAALSMPNRHFWRSVTPAKSISIRTASR